MGAEKKTVLIVDDEPDTLTYFASLLEDNGYIAILASDGGVGLDKLREIKPDLITLDMSMPEKSGVSFYLEIKESEQWRDIPVIIITGISEDFRKFISRRSQIPPPEGYLSKPIEPEEFLAMAGRLTAE